MTDSKDVGTAILQNTANSFLNDRVNIPENILITEANLLVEVTLIVSCSVYESLLQ